MFVYLALASSGGTRRAALTAWVALTAGGRGWCREGGRLSRRGRLRPAEGAYAAGAYGAGAYGAGAYGAGGSDRAGDGVPCIDTVVGRQGGQVHGPGGIAERTV